MVAAEAAGFGDYRRAALLVRYGRLDNEEGIAAILAETNEAERPVQLLQALLGLNKTFIERLRTTEGLALLGEYIGEVSELDASEPPGTDIRRAAHIVDSFMRDDSASIATTMAAATSEGRATQTVRQVLDLFEATQPELNSDTGLQWLQDHVDALQAREHDINGRDR